MLIRAICIVLLWSSVGSAQEIDICAPEVSSNRRAIVEHDGDSGIWFHLEVARCLLGRLETTEAQKHQIRLLTQRLSLSDEREALREREVTLAVEQADIATEALDASVRARKRAEESLERERRFRALWAALGAVVTIGVQILSVWVYSQVAD